MAPAVLLECEADAMPDAKAELASRAASPTGRETGTVRSTAYAEPVAEVDVLWRIASHASAPRFCTRQAR
ncbi:hypothetical protein ADM96_27555 [Burkholderia sp. ST111]|nr:hypothetical protein ADM96_27555 [Burkholderia sp. ST111]